MMTTTTAGLGGFTAMSLLEAVLFVKRGTERTAEPAIHIQVLPS